MIFDCDGFIGVKGDGGCWDWSFCFLLYIELVSGRGVVFKSLWYLLILGWFWGIILFYVVKVRNKVVVGGGEILGIVMIL